LPEFGSGSVHLKTAVFCIRSGAAGGAKNGGEKMADLKPCPFCRKRKVFIAVHDDEGNYHGNRGCDYECDPWSGLSYALHHEGWGDCILCSDGIEQVMGGVLFDTAEEAIEAWNRRAEDG
jgi:hypothetical protein